MSTIPEALRACAASGKGTLTVHRPAESRSRDAASLLATARMGARRLTAIGIGAGDHVGICGPNRLEWADAAFAVWEAGAILVPLPWSHSSLRRGPGPAAHRLARITGCSVVLTPDGSDEGFAGLRTRSWELDTWPAIGADETPTSVHDPDQAAVAQPTSGSTANPKAAVISHRAALIALQSSSAEMGVDADRDRVLAWLPFFHDYGLFGYLLRPFVLGVQSHIMPVESFLQHPVSWFDLVHDVEATITSAPPSAWSLALAAHRAGTRTVDLSSVRLAMIAAEKVPPRLIDRLLHDAPRLRLDRQALAVGYGLAESTLGVSATRPSGRPTIDEVDRASLETDIASEPEGSHPTRRIVSCGEPFANVEVEIRSDDGRVIPERRVGRIFIRGAGTACSYLTDEGRRPLGDANGWIDTGDRGYRSDGELYITGRHKDVIIVAGRNYDPEDIEWTADATPGTRPGRSVAFNGAEDRDGHVVLVVEPRDGTDPETLRMQLVERIGTATGVAIAQVFLVAKGTVTKTSSGKLQRSRMRTRYRDGDLRDIDDPAEHDGHQRIRQADQLSSAHHSTS